MRKVGAVALAVLAVLSGAGGLVEVLTYFKVRPEGFTMAIPQMGLLAMAVLLFGASVGTAGYSAYVTFGKENAVSKLKAQAETFARLKAADVLFKSACRLSQSLQGINVALPLDPRCEADNPGVIRFRQQYQEHDWLRWNSFLHVPNDPIDPLPPEPSGATYAQVERALRVHIELLRGHTVRLNSELLEIRTK
jgi:hypothetical protein